MRREDTAWEIAPHEDLKALLDQVVRRIGELYPTDLVHAEVDWHVMQPGQMGAGYPGFVSGRVNLRLTHGIYSCMLMSVHSMTDDDHYAKFSALFEFSDKRCSSLRKVRNLAFKVLSHEKMGKVMDALKAEGAMDAQKGVA